MNLAPEQLPEDPKLLEEIALRVAVTAADMVREKRAGGFEVSSKSTLNDLVTSLDKASDEMIRSLLLDARPHDGLLTEESAAVESTTGVVWVVDPIDGTTNFCYGLAPYAVSIAATVGSVPVAGAVVEIAFDQRHVGSLGNGSFCNGQELRCGPPPPLANALIGTGFAYDLDRRRRQAEFLVGIVDKVGNIRRHGAAAYDLCSVAAGRLDGFIEVGLQSWDFAAGQIIATEAGARVEALDGAPPRPHEAVLAASAELFEPLKELLLAQGINEV
ncbi:MAG TPA: inositol monophosphatase [Acidimicrobiaceae bacterium]|jgi:myo-inositol-1(or 4)-monophosphatase|nr:inositol monophosphatase [Acidimicrobiaceae bacterium]